MKFTIQPKTVAGRVRKIAAVGSSIYFLLFSQILSAQGITVTGVVKDSMGMAIPGAAVQIHNAKLGVSTDSLGKFKLALKAGSVLDISAVGFNDTSITVGGLQNVLTIVLQSRQNNLQDFVVSANKRNAIGVDPIANRQIIANILSDFAITAGYGLDISSAGGSARVSIMGAQNRLNSGEMLPYYMPKDATRGSRYLFPGYVGGIVIDSSNGLIKNTAPIYNYDKVSGSLIIRKDAKECIEVDKAQVKGFGLKNNDTTYVLMSVPSIAADQYYMFIGAGSKYALFKAIKTKFERSQYQNNGLITSGNNYDEYVDEYQYYLINRKDKGVAPVNFAIKKKAIKQAFASDEQKVEVYFSQHKGDDINEAFVKGLVEYLN